MSRRKKKPITLSVKDYQQANSKYDPYLDKNKDKIDYDKKEEDKTRYLPNIDDESEEFDQACEDTLSYIKEEQEKKPLEIPFYGKKEEEPKTFSAQNFPPKTPKKSRFPWVNWFRGLTEKQQIFSLMVAITVVFALFTVIMLNAVPKEKNEDVVLKNYKKTYELGEEVKIKESTFVNKKKTDATVLKNMRLYSPVFTNSNKYTYDSESGLIRTKDKDFLEVGKYTFTLSYPKDGNAVEKDLVIRVKDTKAPEFKNFNSIIYIFQNSSPSNIGKYFEADDLSGHVKITYKGELDTSKAGTYTVSILAKDDSGNKAKKPCSIHVITAEDIANGKTLSAYADGSVPSGFETAVTDYTQRKIDDAKVKVDKALEDYNEAHQKTAECESNVNAISQKITMTQNNLDNMKQTLSYYEQQMNDAQNNNEGEDAIKYWKEQYETMKQRYNNALANSDVSSLRKDLEAANKELLQAQTAEKAAEKKYNELYSEYQDLAY